MPPRDPPPGNASPTMGSPRKAYASGVLVTTSRSSTAPPSASTTRSMIRRPPRSMSAFGLPPIRVLKPPAWITPVTFMLFGGGPDGPLRGLPDDFFRTGPRRPPPRPPPGFGARAKPALEERCRKSRGSCHPDGAGAQDARGVDGHVENG